MSIIVRDVRDMQTAASSTESAQSRHELTSLVTSQTVSDRKRLQWISRTRQIGRRFVGDVIRATQREQKERTVRGRWKTGPTCAQAIWTLTPGCLSPPLTPVSAAFLMLHSLHLIFTALHWTQRGLVARKVSVCLSVKRVHCDKTEEKSVQIFIPYERSFSLVFW